MSQDKQTGWARFGTWLADNGVLYIVAAGAYGGSLSHWLHLAQEYGQGGLTAWFIAACVDLLAFEAARERAHDAKIGRERKAAVSFPAAVLAFSAVMTLAGNAFTAEHKVGGILLALIPGVVLLISLAFMERRAAESLRRAKVARAQREAEEARQRAADEAAERQRQEAEAAERQRREEAEAEDARRAARERERRDREERRRQAEAERHGGPSPSPSWEASRADSGNVTPNVTGTVTAGGLHAVPPPEARANSPERRAMWAHWAHAIRTERRVPTGEELRRAGGCNEGSAAGRIAAKQWREIEPAASLLRSSCEPEAQSGQGASA